MKQLLLMFWYCGICCSFNAAGQNVQFQAYRGASAQLNSYNDLMNGKSESQQVTVALRYYEPQKINHWMITVKLDNDFMANGYTVPADKATLQFNREENQSTNSTAVLSPPVGFIPLSRFQETPLLSSSSVPIESGFNRTFSFNLNIKGGNHLLTIPNNVYGANYIFTLYEMVNNSPRYIASCTSRADFQINYVGNHGNQLVSITNGAENYQLYFRSLSDLSNGVSVTRNGALKIRSYQGHELILKASKQFMQSSETSHMLPVSVVKAHLSLNAFSGNGAGPQIFTPVPLQVWDQVVARYPGWSNEIVYDLTLTVPGNQPELIDARGHYETFLYFVIVPL